MGSRQTPPGPSQKQPLPIAEGTMRAHRRLTWTLVDMSIRKFDKDFLSLWVGRPGHTAMRRSPSQHWPSTCSSQPTTDRVRQGHARRRGSLAGRTGSASCGIGGRQHGLAGAGHGRCHQLLGCVQDGAHVAQGYTVVAYAAPVRAPMAANCGPLLGRSAPGSLELPC